MIKTDLSIINCLQDRKLLGMFLDDPRTWTNWFTYLKCLFALEPTKEDLRIYKECTKRTVWPQRPQTESWVISGRRSGKSFVTSLIGCYLAAFRSYPELSLGEKGILLIISVSKQQANIIKGYLSTFFNENAFLKSMVKRETRWEIDLTNNVSIKVLSSDFRSLRGYTSIGTVIDEIAFFLSQGQRPDTEVVRAVKPCLATIKNAPMICISSPYSKTGCLFEAYRKYFGKDNAPALVWQSPSRRMNPLLNQELIDRALSEDPEGGSSEWLAEFRSDVQSFVSFEVVQSAIIKKRYELPPLPDVRYFAFTDPAGGSGKDSFCLGISHFEKNGQRILDCVYEKKPPFSPDSTIKEFSDILKRYKCSQVTGDRYASGFCAERFEKNNIRYVPSELTKSEIYLQFLPLVNSNEIQLLDNSRLLNQLLRLERKTGRNRDFVDHGPGGSDDLINAACGALVLASNKEWICPICVINHDDLGSWLQGD